MARVLCCGDHAVHVRLVVLRDQRGLVANINYIEVHQEPSERGGNVSLYRHVHEDTESFRRFCLVDFGACGVVTGCVYMKLAMTASLRAMEVV